MKLLVSVLRPTGTQGRFIIQAFERRDEMFLSFSSANFPAERARLHSACALLQNLSGKKRGKKKTIAAVQVCPDSTF